MLKICVNLKKRIERRLATGEAYIQYRDVVGISKRGLKADIDLTKESNPTWEWISKRGLKVIAVCLMYSVFPMPGRISKRGLKGFIIVPPPPFNSIFWISKRGLKVSWEADICPARLYKRNLKKRIESDTVAVATSARRRSQESQKEDWKIHTITHHSQAQRLESQKEDWKCLTLCEVGGCD